MWTCLWLCALCSWRSSLSSERLKGAAKTTYGGAMAKAAHEAVDAARDLLLQKVEVRTCNLKLRDNGRAM